MRARQIRHAAAAAAAVVSLVGGAGAAPASTAPGPWVRDGDILTAFASWTTVGLRPGLPGNTHRGELFLGTDEGPAVIDLLDWDCPTAASPSTDGECTLLRSQHIQAARGAFVGALRYHVKGVTEIDTETSGGSEPVVTRGYADFSFVRTGPISRSTRVTDDLTVVTLSAPMKLTGYLGPTRFADPALDQTVGPYTHDIYYVRG